MKTVPPHSATSEVASPEFDDSIDLFGIFLTLGENLRLLVLGPLLAGALAYGVGFLLPPQYASTAILRGEPSVAAYMTTPVVLDAALLKLGYFENLNEEQAEEVRESLLQNMEARAGRNDKLVTLTVRARTPQAAQALTSEILKNVYLASQPRDNERAKLEAERTALLRQLNELDTTGQKALKILDDPAPSINIGALVESISTISDTSIKVRDHLARTEDKLNGLTEEDLLQHPTLSKQVASPKKGLMAVVAALATAIALLILVFLRQSWTSSRGLEGHQQRLHALKRKYGLAK